MMMASVVAGGNRKKSLTLKGVDPETCMIVFKNHWLQVVKILEKHEPSRSSTGALSFLTGHHGNSTSGSGTPRLGPIPADEASAVQNYVEHMLFLLMEEEAGKGGAMGPILEFVVLEGVMERLFLWSLRRQFTDDMKLEQLRMYQMLLCQAKQPLLHHKPVLRPLMMLLASCAGAATDSGGVVEAELVLLLNQLCVALVKDPSVLELFFHTSEDQGAANFLLFSLLIPYTHRPGLVGQQARDALLLIMSLSASEPRVARHIADNTYFCPVLATGLSGLYSSLPARLQVYSEDWHCLDRADWQQVPALVQFLHSLDFCSAVTKVAHPSIRCQLLGYIYNGFLVPVLAPALHKLTVEEVMTTTAYLDLFLRSISEPALLQTFLSFILLHTHDGVHILDTLVSRVNTPFQLGTVSLALFRTLIGLFCEDVMLQLVFRYLVPCSHLSRKQRRSLKLRDCCSSSAASFLLLMPSWCPVHLHSAYTRSAELHRPDAVDLSVSDGVGHCRGSDFLMDVNYLHYLWDARQAVSTSHRACRFWSAPYDGVDPPSLQRRADTPGDDVEDEDEVIGGDSVGSSVVSPPPPAPSPTPSSSDTVSTGNQAGRAGSALDLEWDDFFVEEDSAPSGSDGGGCGLPPAPPRHIQEMRRSATRLVRGSYVEESEFEDDALVYDLVAQTDTNGTAPEPTKVASRRSQGTVPRGATAAGTVTETVNSIMSTRRRSEERRRRSEDWGKDLRRTEEDGEDPGRRSVRGGEPCLVVNGFDVDESAAESSQEHLDDITAGWSHTHTTHLLPGRDTHPSPDGPEPPPRCGSPHPPHSNDFLSQYHELMMSLGAEPDCDDLTDDMDAFRRRVHELRRKLRGEEEQEEEEEEGTSDFDVGSHSDEEGDAEEEEEEEGGRGGAERGMKTRGTPSTGPFISVLLSRLENLLENSIVVNLLLTGILAQLAAYPQPLLQSFLLGANPRSRPGVRTLHQVLVSVGAQVERYVAARPECAALVTRAWRFLLAKDQDGKFRECLRSPGGDLILDPSLPNGSVRTALPLPPLSVLPPCPHIPPQAKSRVFAVILYAEFLKELAAIAQEYNVAADDGWAEPRSATSGGVNAC